MLLKPLTQTLGSGNIFWLALAMSSTLAGNFTLIGSVANLIVVQQARRKVEIGFMEYFRVGALITVATIAIGILVLVLEVRAAHGAEGVEGQNKQQSIVTITPVGHSEIARTLRVVLLCDTPDARTRGLQGFRRLGRDEAALFVFEKPEAVAFWMGTVTYPIDIIFVGPDNKIMRIYRNCKPGSRDLYPSVKRVKWVIETSAGSRIKVGDRVKIEGARVMGPSRIME
jgi:uncharacterized membrane protein (UPF0127 family)